eukprot:Gb_18364 [translate_table: standard]
MGMKEAKCPCCGIKDPWDCYALICWGYLVDGLPSCPLKDVNFLGRKILEDHIPVSSISKGVEKGSIQHSFSCIVFQLSTRCHPLPSICLWWIRVACIVGVDLCFDQLVFKLSENMFAYYKSRAASKLLDPAFLFASDNADKYAVTPRRYDALFKMRRVKV